MANPAYAHPAYRKARARLMAGGPVCAHCGRPGTEADHQPPLVLHRHVEGSGCCQLVASCAPCARRQGAILQGRVTSPRPTATASAPAAAAPPPEPVGYPPTHPVWAVMWLDCLRDVPADAAWPRLMTPPHPAAVGSYGAELAAYAHDRTGTELRWWQRLAGTRLLEHDADGLLCWDAANLTVARQVGKSHLLRELAMWRLHQGDRWHQPQTVVHTGKDLNICVEVQRPARRQYRTPAYVDVYKVRDANGQEQIEYLLDGSRWMVRAKDGVYGLSASLALVDEAWAIPATTIEEGLVPTMVELTASQLLLVSTAHRKATALMLNRRMAACADLDATAGDLWLEWSAAPDAELDDEAGWRAASPHWTDRRRRMVAGRLAAARSGESDDPDEPDPLAAFTAQWLNRWPATRRRPGPGEPLLDADAWDACTGTLATTGAGFVAIEDWFGRGASAAFAVGDDAGRFEVDGEACKSWDAAIEQARLFVVARPGSRLVVGANMRAQVPADFPNRSAMRGAGQTETHRALPLLRALVAAGQIVHDDTADLDAQVTAARVKPLPSGGLTLSSHGRSDLLRAALWALDAAQTVPARPAVH